MFIVDIEKKKKNIKINNKGELLFKETIVTYNFQEQKMNRYVCYLLYL